MPLDRQDGHWRELSLTRIPYEDVEPHTRGRVVAMSGIEDDAERFDRWAVRTEPDPALRDRFRRLRSVEARQRRGLAPPLHPPGSVLATAPIYERGPGGLAARVGRIEPGPRRPQGS